MQLPDRSEPWQSKDISPDGRLLAFGTREGAVLWLSAETGEFLATTDSAQPISQVAFSNDGSRLASTSVYGTMALWDPSSFRSVSSFRAHLLAADGVAFSPDGRRLATGGTTSRDTLRLWDLLTHRELITLSGQPVATSFVTFSPDGRWLVACSKNEGKLYIWCAPSWEEIEADEKRLESGQSPLQE
jgi:WD40 repeat protein